MLRWKEFGTIGIDPNISLIGLFASDDWEAPVASNNLQIGGKFKITVAAKDKGTSFDFTGFYTTVKERELIEYDIDDGRHARVEFKELPQSLGQK
ncbi:hypothetical protein BH18THE1_BH18THE1_03100 [soil metagenome]